MKRLVAALVLVVTAAGTAQAGQLGDAPSGPLAGGDDLSAALAFEDRMGALSLHEGHAVPVDLDPAGHVVSTGGWGDSGLWTGVYEGGEAMRYAVARRHLIGATGQDKQFWRDQKDQALARLTTTLDAEHRDIVIAQDWTGHLKVPPAVNPGTDPTGETHLADFGGGVIPGEAGMIMRACTPVGLGPLGVNDPTVDAANPVNDNSNRVFRITWTHGDGRTYNCETSPSRDTYAGVTFGLLTAYDLIDVPALRDRIRSDLQVMGDFLFKYGWSYPRPHGYVSANHDFDGFISPLFVYVPMARLSLTNAVRHVLDDGTDLVAKAKWDAIWAEELAAEGPQLAGSMQVDVAQPNDGYYKFNLHHLNAFGLMRTTRGPVRALFAQALSVLDKTTGDDLNAHFEAVMYGITGDGGRRDAAVTHLRDWRTYKARVEAGTHVLNSSKCGTTLVCVPKDQYGVVGPTGEIDWFPGTSTSKRASRPLPVVDRAPSDFVWQREPTILDGQEPATHREPAIDYLTPYWMLRYETEVAPPAASPLPTWPGPAHV